MREKSPWPTPPELCAKRLTKAPGGGTPLDSQSRVLLRLDPTRISETNNSVGIALRRNTSCAVSNYGSAMSKTALLVANDATSTTTTVSNGFTRFSGRPSGQLELRGAPGGLPQHPRRM